MGRAGLTLTPYGGAEKVAVADAFMIGPPPAMRVVAPPVISGTVAVGRTVQASAGTWTPGATALRYQWSANGAAIRGATGAAFTIPAGLLGKRLTVTVTASRAGHTAAAATSARTAAVARGAAPRATKQPRVAGTPRVGRTVTVDVGEWSPKADSYRYQ